MKYSVKIDYYDWKLNIYYAITPQDKQDILDNLNCSSETLQSINTNLEKSDIDTGFTFSNYNDRNSIIVMHKASSIGEFINTYDHERTHLIMQICEALSINPYSEEAAHLNGYISQSILEKMLCEIVEL